MTFDCSCCETVEHPLLQVEERGRKVTFLNEERYAYVKVRFDGCICKEELVADWIVERRGRGQVIVELKGRDIQHGLKQINATAEYLVKNGLRHGKIGAVVAGSQIPKASTTIQKAQAHFKRNYLGNLVVKSSTCNVEFDVILGI
jgi:hypothetical protein